MSQYLVEMKILQQRAEVLARAKKEMENASNAYAQQMNRVRWYQWVDILLTQLGVGWDIISDTSDPEICGRMELLPAEQYKGQVVLAHPERPTRVWTKQEGVLYVGHPGTTERVFPLIGPNVLSTFAEVCEYIAKLNSGDVHTKPHGDLRS